MPSQFSDRRHFLHDLPRWYLLALLVWAPWCYGSTRQWSADLLGILTAVLGGLWLFSLALRRKLPKVPLPLTACVAFLLVYGWWLIANADHRYDRLEYRFIPIPPLVSWLPGSADVVDAIPAMIRATGIFAVFLFVADLVQRPTWRKRLWWTIALTGASIAIYGIGRKILGLHLQSEVDPEIWSETSFATYFYHGNAGAFVNLVLPFVWGLAAMSWRRWDTDLQKIVWIPALLLCLSSAIVIASKAAIAITAGLLAVLVIMEFRRLLRSGELSGKGVLLYGSLALIAAVVAVGFGWNTAARRWVEIKDSPHLAFDRLVAYQVELKMLADSGVWGFGPGNFSIAFPHYTAEVGERIRGFWKYAHQDYLQTAIEWGYVGSVFWSLILLGALLRGFLTLRRGAMASADYLLVLAAFLALLGVAAHAAVDFPLQVASLQLYAAVATGLLWGSGSIGGSSR